MTNILNPGFDLGTWTRDTHTGQEFGEIFTPTGWVTFWKEGLPVPHDPNNQDGYGRPEVHVIEKTAPFLDPPRVYEGNYATQLFTFYRIHDAGFYQVVGGLKPGDELELTCYAHAWSSIDDDPHTSNLDGEGYKNFTFMVGIDPEGGTDPWGDSVVWGEGAHIYNEYARVPSARVAAISTSVTIFLRSTVLWPFKHCDAYFDSVELTVHTAQPSNTVPYYQIGPYDKVTYVADANCDLNQWLEVAHDAFPTRSTVTGSIDDALGHQPGQNTTAIVYGTTAEYRRRLEQYRDEYYPGAEFEWRKSQDANIIYPYPIVANGSKLHVHAIGEGGIYDMLNTFADNGYTLPYCKVLATQPSDLQALYNLKNVSPGTKFIARVMSVPGSGVNIEGPDFNSDPASYMAALLPTMESMRDQVEYWELFNEQDPVGVEGHVKMANWLVGCMDIAEEHGFKLALLSYSMGVPEMEEWRGIWEQTDFFPRARAGGHILSLHAYGTMPGDAQFILLRHRNLYNQILIPNDCVVPYVMTEYNIDEPVGGWTEQALLAQYAAYDTELSKEYYCLGASLFTMGIGWDDYNITSHSAAIADYILSVRNRENSTGGMPPSPNEVESFSQRDPRWGGIKLGTSPYTMHTSGCLVTATTSKATEKYPDTDPGKLVNWLNDNGGFTSDGLLIWAKPPEYYSGMYFNPPYHTWRQPGQVADLNVVRDAMANGVAIAQVDFHPRPNVNGDNPLTSHFVVLVEETDAGYVIMDPWDGKFKNLEDSYWRGSKEESIFALGDYRWRESCNLGINDWTSETISGEEFLVANQVQGDHHVVLPVYVWGGSGGKVTALSGTHKAVVLNYSWSTDMGGAGTLPKRNSEMFNNFVAACVNTINQSPDIDLWIIGNEFNNPRESPIDDNLTPDDVIEAYNAIASGVSAKLAVGALDPFNAVLGDPRDWLTAIYNGISRADVVTAHGYIRGPRVDLIGSQDKFANAPLQWQYLNYPGCVTELLKSLPDEYKNLPVWVTEFNHLWKDDMTYGWVDDSRASDIVAAAAEAAANAGISHLALYRWSGDNWQFSNNQYVLQEFTS